MAKTDSRFTVLHLIDNFEIGGAQAVVGHLARERRCSEVNVVVCALRDGPLRASIEQSGAPVYVLRKNSCPRWTDSLHIFRWISIYKALSRLVAKHSVDLIQTHVAGPWDFLLLFLRRQKSGTAIVWTFHGPDFLPQKPGSLLGARRFVCRILYRLLAARPSAIVAVSDAVREAASEQIGSRGAITTIRNGVDTSLFADGGDRSDIRTDLGIGSESRLVLSVGRFVEVKCHAMLLKASAMFLKQREDVHLLLAGNGDLREMLEHEAERTGYSDRIHFLGYRGDVPSLLAAADVFVLSSQSEGLAIALLEAMAAGKAIVATAAPGTSEVLKNRTTGMLIPPGDPGALAAAILECLSDRNMAEKMGASARLEVLANYDVKRQMRDYGNLYRRIKP
jgi:glycosyltransferase involved in cell wall biosynthesis